MNIVMLVIDLANNVFALRGLDETGRVAIKRPAVVRGKPRPCCPSGDLSGAQFRHEQSRLRLNQASLRRHVFEDASQVRPAEGELD